MPHLGSFKHNMTMLPGQQCQAPPSVHYKLLGYASKYQSQACLFCTISRSSAMQHLQTQVSNKLMYNSFQFYSYSKIHIVFPLQKQSLLFYITLISDLVSK